jgi:hypothetical protein
LTSTIRNPSSDGEKKFITMRKFSDMRGFVLVIKYIFTSGSVTMAEVVGENRILVDSVYVPATRSGAPRTDK